MKRDKEENPRQNTAAALMDSVVNTGDDFNGCNGSSCDVTCEVVFVHKELDLHFKEKHPVSFTVISFRLSLTSPFSDRFLG